MGAAISNRCSSKKYHSQLRSWKPRHPFASTEFSISGYGCSDFQSLFQQKVPIPITRLETASPIRFSSFFSVNYIMCQIDYGKERILPPYAASFSTTGSSLFYYLESAECHCSKSFDQIYSEISVNKISNGRIWAEDYRIIIRCNQ